MNWMEVCDPSLTHRKSHQVNYLEMVKLLNCAAIAKRGWIFSKVGFLSLIAMVINCTAQIVQESQKIDWW